MLPPRFHQYYVSGETADCSNWSDNYSDCQLWLADADRSRLTWLSRLTVSLI